MACKGDTSDEDGSSSSSSKSVESSLSAAVKYQIFV